MRIGLPSSGSGQSHVSGYISRHRSWVLFIHGPGQQHQRGLPDVLPYLRTRYMSQSGSFDVMEARPNGRDEHAAYHGPGK